MAAGNIFAGLGALTVTDEANRAQRAGSDSPPVLERDFHDTVAVPDTTQFISPLGEIFHIPSSKIQSAANVPAKIQALDLASTNRSGSFLDSSLPITDNPEQDLEDFINAQVEKRLCAALGRGVPQQREAGPLDMRTLPQTVRQLVQPVREPFDRGGTVLPVRPVDSAMRTLAKDTPLGAPHP